LAKLTGIRGLDEASAERLRAVGVGTQDKLVAAGSTPAERRRLASVTGLSAEDLQAWVNRAEIGRIRGVSSIYGRLLEEAGVASVPDLARREPERLHAALAGINAGVRLTTRPPTLVAVSAWIAQAKDRTRTAEESHGPGRLI